MPDINTEMAKLYIEASSLVIKLTNFIKQNDIPNSSLHISAANSFIKRNTFYSIAVNGFIKPDKPETKPEIKQVRAEALTISEKAPEINNDDLW